MECHHKLPLHMGGKNDYRNLVWITADVHKLIHATSQKTIEKYRNLLLLNSLELVRVNSLRNMVGNLNVNLE